MHHLALGVVQSLFHAMVNEFTVIRIEPPPSAILFDAVGTLIYPEPSVAVVYSQIAARHGVRLAESEIAGRFGPALATHSSSMLTSSEAFERVRWQRVVAEVFCEFPAAQAAGEMFDELWRHFARPAAWKVFDDVTRCLQSLRECNYSLGIVSNFDGRLHDVVQGHPAIAQLPCFVSSEVGFAKPHAQLFATVAERLALPAERLLLVGDDPVADYEGAISAGWQAVLLDRKRESQLASISGLEELSELLAGGNSS